MSGWPLAEEQQDWSRVAEWDDEVERRAAELMPVDLVAFARDVLEVNLRPGQQRLLEGIHEHDRRRREAQADGGGSWMQD